MIADKLKSMKCVGGNEQEAETVEDENVLEDRGRYMHLPAQRESFADQPSSSGQQSNTMMEQMDIDVPSTSGAFVNLPSTSAGVANEGELQMDDLAKLLGNEDKSIFLLNFHQLNDLIDSISTDEDDGERPGQHERTDKGQCTSDNTGEGNSKNRLPLDNKKTGELRVYKTGSMAIAFGDRVFDIVQIPGPPCEQEVVRVELDEATQSGAMTSLGKVQQYCEVIPQMEEDIYENDENACMCSDKNVTGKADTMPGEIGRDDF